MWATNLKVLGVVLGTLLVYTVVCNKIPQMQSEVPQKLSLGPNATPEQGPSARAAASASPGRAASSTCTSPWTNPRPSWSPGISRSCRKSRS